MIELRAKFDILYNELNNLNILRNQYGIDIPDKDLSIISMDQDLLQLYQQQKYDRQFHLEKAKSE